MQVFSTMGLVKAWRVTLVRVSSTLRRLSFSHYWIMTGLEHEVSEYFFSFWFSVLTPVISSFFKKVFFWLWTEISGLGILWIHCQAWLDRSCWIFRSLPFLSKIPVPLLWRCSLIALVWNGFSVDIPHEFKIYGYSGDWHFQNQQPVCFNLFSEAETLRHFEKAWVNLIP